MEWLDHMWRCWEQQNAFERDKATTAINEIPVNVSDLTKIVITSDYTGPSPLPILRDALSKAPGLKSIHIGLRLNWQDICSLDFSSIEELSFCLKGTPGIEVLVAAHLKSLTIYGDHTLTPIEYMISAAPHIDYSGMTSLNRLELRNLLNIDPSDFIHLNNLKSLAIKGWETDNCKWFSEADYHLQQIYIENASVDCADLTSQQELESICFYHCAITNGECLEKLPRLKKLDLRYCTPIKSTFDLHLLSIEKVYITNQDTLKDDIERAVHAYMEQAVRSILWENKSIHNIEKRHRYAYRTLYQNIITPLQIRVMRKIKQYYESDIERYETESFPMRTNLSREDYLSLYRETAMRVYPFLAESDELMQYEPQSTEDIQTILEQSGISMEDFLAFKETFASYSTYSYFDTVYDVFGKDKTTIYDDITGAEIPVEFLNALKSIKHTNPSFGAIIESMIFVKLDVGTLHVGFLQKNMMLMMLLERKKSDFEKVFSESFRRPIHLEVEIVKKSMRK